MAVVNDGYMIERAEEESYVDWISHIDPEELNQSLRGDREVEVDEDFEVPF